MAVTYREFRIELYQEHLEEASFLYEQRLGLFHDPEISWLDIGEFEERLEAHIDALVVGEDLALDICRTRSREGDFGELYAAVCVFCRQKRRELVADVLKELEPTDAERVRAVADALKRELPDEWEEPLFNGISKGYPGLIPLLAEVVGYRRVRSLPSLEPLLSRVPEGALPRVLWALGRQGDPAVIPRLSAFLDHADPKVRTASAIALLRLGDEEIRVHCLQATRRDEAFVLPVALAGGRSAAPLAALWSEQGQARRDAVDALGILGELSAVDVLLTSLADDRLADAAANALNLITGANLYETAFVPEQFEEAELFEHELEDFRKGQPPTRPGGEPFGTRVRRIAQEPGRWRHWLIENKARFDARFRYRLGRPYTVASTLETLQSAHVPYRIRQLAGEEAIIRYRFALHFEAEMPVTVQQAALASVAQQVRLRQQAHRDGGWYFSDRPIA
jgi:uncharacterized protein (TIGR02270 family)